MGKRTIPIIVVTGTCAVGVIIGILVLAFGVGPGSDDEPWREAENVEASNPQTALGMMEYVLASHDLCLSIGGREGSRVKMLSLRTSAAMEALEGLVVWVPVAVRTTKGGYVAEMAPRDRISAQPPGRTELAVAFLDADDKVAFGSVPKSCCTRSLAASPPPPVTVEKREEQGQTAIYINGQRCSTATALGGPVRQDFDKRDYNEILLIVRRRGGVVIGPQAKALMSLLIADGYEALAPYYASMSK